MADEPFVRNTAASFDAAESNLKEIIHTICEQKWEHEVLKEKLIPFSTEIVC